MSRQRGFTLIELLIVVLVIAVLAAIAISSYREQVRKSRRATAFNDVSTMQLQLERWRAENPSYANCTSPPTPCGSGTYPTTTITDTYYTIGPPTGVTTSSYTITATPRGDQVGDRCGVLCALPPGGTATATCGTTKPLWANSACN